MFKDCYKSIIKRKADEKREANKEGEEGKRDTAINDATVSTTGTRKAKGEVDKDKKQRETIANAGGKRNSIFF